MARRDLTDTQAKRVLSFLRSRLARVHGGNVLALSRELGYTQSALWQLLNDRTYPSLAMAAALARCERRSLESILSSPRDRAVELAREAGMPEGAIARLLEEPEREELRPVLSYVDRIRAYAVLDEGASGETPSRRQAENQSLTTRAAMPVPKT